MPRIILTDIEGTTSSLGFARQVLFPYALREMPRFVRVRGHEPGVRRWLDEVATELGGVCQDGMIAETLQGWIEQGLEHTALKALQDMLWADGYRNGDFTAHVYADAARRLKQWHGQGHTLAVYSSSSAPAQVLFFSHTDAGDLSPVFSAWFDPEVGGKREAQSYARIAGRLDAEAPEVLFLSDVVAELDAARDAGMATILIDRRDQPQPRTGDATGGHVRVESFDDIQP